jgi:hypothetical protein
VPSIPWIVAVCAGTIGGCVFNSHDSDARFTCSDGVCPGGQMCVAGVCGIGDAAPIDGAHLTCGAPGITMLGQASLIGTTIGLPNTLATACGSVSAFNGADAVYELDDLAIGHHLDITFFEVDSQLAGSSLGMYAYLLASCSSGRSPTCYGDVFASSSQMSSLDVTVTSTPLYVVVDGLDPSTAGSFTLTISED